MSFNFDQKIDRRNSNALAVEGYKDYLFGGKNIVPKSEEYQKELISMWVADMQFSTVPIIVEAIKKRLEHPVFGYTMNFDNELYKVFHEWSMKKYNWSFEEEEMLVALGVIPSLYDLIDCICKEDEKIITMTPAYGFFKHAATYHKKDLIISKLVEEKGDYFIDYEDFEIKVSDPNVKLFFLCHPHNPTGRVWSEDELLKLGKICLKHNVIVVSDEIHCDLLRVGKKHTPLAKLFPDEKNIITCMAPSKTFNLAGMMVSITIIRDKKLREVWRERTYPFINPLGLAAATAAFKDGYEWLEELRKYLDNNFFFLDSFIKKYLPKASFKIPGATYLAWINLEDYFQDSTINLTQYFVENAGVILEGGEMFVDNGGVSIRLNLACPKSQIELTLKQIYKAIKLNARV